MSLELTPEEHRFLADSLRNIIFDLLEDDPEKWDGAVEELRAVMSVIGEGSEDGDETSEADETQDDD